MRRPGSPDRSVVAGFTGLLLLMGALTIDSAIQIRRVSAASAILRKGSRDRDALLDELRTDTYRAATLARDYVLEHDELYAASQKAELVALRSHVEETLRRLSASAPAGEEETIESLKQRAESYWSSLAPAPDPNRFATRQEGERLLRTIIVPRRDEVVQFVRQVGALDNRILDAAEERIQLVQARFEDRVSTISLLALVLGSILAAVVVRHVKRLDAESRSRFDEVLKTREDLKRLSDRLVTVQEDERRRLSRELHDDLGQAMSAMLIELRKAEAMPAGSQRRTDELAAARRLAEENVAKVRNMALLLRPAMLDELGLVPALRWHTREVARRTGLRVRLMADDLHDDLAEPMRTCIYRVVQEALHNCVKHAQANEVRVVMQRDGGGLLISVQDDGLGFDPELNRGLGLLGMVERVTALGGRIHVGSQPGKGTVVSTYFLLESDQCKMAEESVA
ncbi:MAG TPA: sensor histidine kinase [Candidatus Acidoferrales bacterium]|nr:sensor histidine kinase [Candidatus Acidoferrales bacterium]